MVNAAQIEQAYQNYTGNLPSWLPDGIVNVDDKFLEEKNLTSILSDTSAQPYSIKDYFSIIETDEKITLFNEEFVIWIVQNKIYWIIKINEVFHGCFKY